MGEATKDARASRSKASPDGEGTKYARANRSKASPNGEGTKYARASRSKASLDGGGGAKRRKGQTIGYIGSTERKSRKRKRRDGTGARSAAAIYLPTKRQARYAARRGVTGLENGYAIL